jgi:hypothetical protein
LGPFVGGGSVLVGIKIFEHSTRDLCVMPASFSMELMSLLRELNEKLFQ